MNKKTNSSKTARWLFCTAFAVLFLTQQTTAQSPAVYDRTETFTPLFYSYPGSEIRTADGRPGPKYWQNKADYSIAVTLDTILDKLTGRVVITYTNNSPQPLDFLWLHLDQNFKRKESRYRNASVLASVPFNTNDFTQGIEIKHVAVIKNKKQQNAEYIVNDTRMQIRLPDAVPAKGGVISIEIDYSFTTPEKGADRMGITKTKNGKIYQVAQWYPRMAVYDDVEGWNIVPYQIGTEFYLPYGNFNYTITAPADMLIAGSGNLLNEKAVLSSVEQKNLERARKSDSTMLIRTASSAIGIKGTKTWKFNCAQARDVAWTASAAFIWDAARINLPNGKKALAMSVYPEESAIADGWKRSTAFTKEVIEMYSKKWYPYPYPSAINVAGDVDGMEYPGIVFCSKDASGGSLWEVTAHEFGHNWFPMIVGSNERKYAWMDEGFSTFITELATRSYNKGEFYSPASDSLAQFQIKRLFAKEVLPILSTPMVGSFTEIYWKPSVGLKLLRNEILGTERFDYALRNYIKQWAFRHPTPWDFFRAMDNAAGEDLNWFWRSWFLNTWKLDQSIESVKYIDSNDLEKGVKVTIGNNEKMVMPATIRITEQNGTVQLVKIPVEIWQKGRAWTFWYPSTSLIKEIQIDPGKQLPDINRANNFWIPQALIK